MRVPRSLGAGLLRQADVFTKHRPPLKLVHFPHKTMRRFPDLTHLTHTHWACSTMAGLVQGERERERERGKVTMKTLSRATRLLSGGAMFHELKMPAEIYRVLHSEFTQMSGVSNCKVDWGHRLT